MNIRTKWSRFVCIIIMAAMVITMLPTIVFAENEKKLYINYQSVFNGYGAGGTFTIDGVLTDITNENSETWTSGIPNEGYNIDFTLTPPNDSYPGTQELYVVLGGIDITSSRVTDNSFTITPTDFQNEDMGLNIYWSEQEKAFNEFGPQTGGIFPISMNIEGMSSDKVNVASAPSMSFGRGKTILATPDSDGIVTVTLEDTPSQLEFNSPSGSYNLIQNPVVFGKTESDDDAIMIEYSETDRTITFHTGVGILREMITNEYGGTENGWANLWMKKVTIDPEDIKIQVNYQSVANGQGAGGTFTVDGVSTTITPSNTWFEISPNGKDVEFTLTPPNDTYPGTKELYVILNGTDVTASRISGNSFTIRSTDCIYDNGCIDLTIYWSEQEKAFNNFGPQTEGIFPIFLSIDGMSSDMINVANAPNMSFGRDKKISATPDSDGIVTVTLEDTPSQLQFNGPGPEYSYNLIQNQTVVVQTESGTDATMIEYSQTDRTITFHTKVGILKEMLTDKFGGTKSGWANLWISKGGGPGPGPGPQGPRVELRHPINDCSGSLVLDQTDPDNRSYVKYDMPLQYLYFFEIPVDQDGNTVDGNYDDLVKQGFDITYTWPKQEDFDHRLNTGDFVNFEITLNKAGMNEMKFQAGNQVMYEANIDVTKFEVAEPIVVTQNYDGVAVTDATGKYFKYNYQDKVKFNIEFTISYMNPDQTQTTETYQYYGVTIDEAMHRAGTAQRVFLMADFQKDSHWEAGHSYDAYFALAGVIAKGKVLVEESEIALSYWENLAENAVAEIAPENVLPVKSIEPENNEQATVIFEQTVSKPNDEKYRDQKLFFKVVPNKNDFTKGTINVYRTYESTLPGIFKPDFITSFENVSINYIFDQSIAAEVSGYKSNFKTFDYNQKDPLLHYYDNLYLITDLDMVNVEVNGGLDAIRDAGNLINFSSEFLNDVKHTNLETQFYVSDNQHWEGRGAAMHYGCGQLLLIYDDTVYGIVDKVGYMLLNVIYIPDDTPKTEGDFRTAALERIKALLKGKDDDYEIGPDDHWASPGGAAAGNANGDIESQRMHQLFLSALSMEPGETDVTAHTVDVCYRFGVKDIGRMALWIVADSSKMQEQSEVLMKSVDLKTGASVSTTDANLPLDAKIAVTQHIDDDIYEDQMSRIGLEEGIVFDIDINSVMKEGKIQKTEVEGGLFEVRIPVPETYADSVVNAYYTPDSGEIELYEAEVVKDTDNQYYAVFYTDHFSTYTIGDEAKVVKEIAIKNTPTKLEYFVNEGELDLEGGQITISYVSGETKDIDMTLSMISGFDNTQLGNQTITVTYGGKTATFDVIIITPEVKINGAKLGLKNKVLVRFLLEVEEESSDDYTVVYSVKGKSTEQLLNTFEQDADGQYEVDVQMVAKEMTEPIEICVKDSEGNVVSNQVTYSVEQYCKNKLADATEDEKLKDLCAAILNYGAYAQKHFGYNVDNPANRSLPEYGYDTAAPEVEIPQSKAVKSGETEGLTAKGAALGLKEATIIRFTFALEEDADITAYTFTCNGSPLQAKEEDGQYVVDITGIAAKNMDNRYKLEVKKGEEGTLAVEYSILTYLYNKQNVTEKNLGDLCKAMYQYHLSAKEYFSN